MKRVSIQFDSINVLYVIIFDCIAVIRYRFAYPKLYVIPNFVGCNIKRVLNSEHSNPRLKHAAKPVSLCVHVRPQSVEIVSLRRKPANSYKKKRDSHTY